MSQRNATLVLCLLPALFESCCRSPQPTTPCPCANRTLRLATTTSVDSTGLLGALLPVFEQATGIKVQVLAVGTGQALKLAENGDADVVLAHDPEAEQQFIEAGFGVNHRRLMHNDMVVIGPPDDPARVRGQPDAITALRQISERGGAFVSRGDQSGTHRAELRLWAASGIEPKGAWYLESGQGMRPTLTLADEKKAYCLTDRATFLTAKDKISLTILVEGDPKLLNVYSIAAVNPARHPTVRYREAMELIAWLSSPEGQRRIGEFKQGAHILFNPDAIPTK
jgi:tungstate transport system substrate-binding protein